MAGHVPHAQRPLPPQLKLQDKPGSPRVFPPRVIALCGGLVTIGGAERMILAALAFLRRQGVAVHCVLNEWENHRIAAAIEPLGITWSTGRYRHTMLKRTQSVRERFVAAFGMMVTSGETMMEYARAPGSVMFAPDFGAVLRNGPALLLLGAFGVKLILYLQNAPPAGRFYERLFKRAIDPLVDRYAVASNDTGNVLREFGIAAHKIDVVRNFAPGEAPAPTSQPRIPGRVIFVAQMIPQKGLDMLLEAVAIVSSMGVEVSLDVVGRLDGWVHPAYKGYRDELLKRAAKPDLAERVSFLGYREDVHELLSRSQIHCAPSRPEMYEGMPLVCLEAKRAGTPSVVTPVGPFREMIEHRIDGWICRDVSAEAIAEGLLYFLRDPRVILEAGNAAARSSRSFGLEHFESEWTTVFEKLRSPGDRRLRAAL